VGPIEVRGVSRMSRREVLRRSGLLSLAAFGHGVLAACTPTTGGTASQQPSAQDQPVKGGNLVEGRYVEDASLLQPVLAPSTPFTYLLFQGLIDYNVDGSLRPLLAQSLPKVSSDGLSYTFDLRKDVKWSDGTPLTADDVVFTYRTMYHPDYKAFPSYRRASLESILADVKVIDPYTVVMTTKKVSAAFVANECVDLLMPKHILGNVAPAALKDHPFNQAPTVSSGPFKFKEWVKGDHLTGVRNELYHGGLPYLDSYITRFMPQEAVINALKTGEIDTGQLSLAGRFDELKTVPNLNFFTFATISGYHFFYNLSKVFFADKVVRQALWYAADFEGMNKAVLFGYGGVPTSTGVFPPASWANDPNGKPVHAFDKAKANALLEQAGWKLGSGAIRAKDGIPLKFEILVPALDAWTQAAQILQQGWKDVGCDAAVRPVQINQLTQAGLDRTFDVLMWSLQPSGKADPDPSGAFHSRQAAKGGLNYSSYQNAQVDSLLDQAVATFDQTQRKELYRQLQSVLNEDIPNFTSTWVAFGWATNKRVKGMGSEQLGSSYTMHRRWFLDKVWVTDGR
jgi:peptide/nickel transport system substrate-binding protein